MKTKRIEITKEALLNGKAYILIQQLHYSLNRPKTEEQILKECVEIGLSNKKHNEVLILTCTTEYKKLDDDLEVIAFVFSCPDNMNPSIEDIYDVLINYDYSDCVQDW